MGRVADALREPGLGAIAEIKRRSPSAGDIKAGVIGFHDHIEQHQRDVRMLAEHLLALGTGMRGQEVQRS